MSSIHGFAVQAPGDSLLEVENLRVSFAMEHGVARDAMQTKITQRLLNVPADTALELLAAQGGFAVVRKGNTFRVISNPGA